MRQFFWVLLCMVFAPTSALAEWWNDEWSYRKEIAINAGEGGVILDEDLENFPVLVRLTTENFTFLEGKFDGSDLRFVASDGATLLRHYIESYDVNNNLAFVWVRIPAIRSGVSQTIHMYYGNDAADDISDSALVFDDSEALAYDFGLTSGVPQDVSGNFNNARSAAEIRSAFIGNGAGFDGRRFLVTPSSSNLVVRPESSFSASMWVSLDQAQERAILMRRTADSGPAAFALGVDDRRIFIEIVGGDGETETALLAPSAVPLNEWTHVAVTVEGGAPSVVKLFVNGAAVATAEADVPFLNGRLYFGGDPDARVVVTASDEERGEPGTDEGERGRAAAGLTQDGREPSLDASNFVGVLDQVRLSRSASSDAYIRASYLDQGPEGSLVQYGVDQEKSSPLFDVRYFAVVITSVTVEGWVVIALLMMLLMSGLAVFLTKPAELTRVERSNKRFLRDYGEAESFEMLSPDSYRHSTLAELYGLARAQIEKRGATGADAKALPPNALRAIQSDMEVRLTTQLQRLNARVGILSLSVSGAPFLGLLGTVIGVMVTFAGVAVEGNVNVNAIAPGVAAALFTTVAGLFVAIPSLFVYNAIVGRIRRISATTMSFLDALVGRVADEYGDME